MDNETLGQRTKRVLKDAGLSPRILSAVSKVHYTTIYRIIDESNHPETIYPNTVQALTNALDGIEGLLEKKVLPFPNDTKHLDRAEKLGKLLSA